MRKEAMNRIKGKIGLKNICILETDDERQIVWDALNALEKADLYKWHDLRKNPEDLPGSNEDVLILDCGDTGVGYFSDIDRKWYVLYPHAYEGDMYCSACEVTAWRYIEAVEEVE